MRLPMIKFVQFTKSLFYLWLPLLLNFPWFKNRRMFFFNFIPILDSVVAAGFQIAITFISNSLEHSRELVNPWITNPGFSSHEHQPGVDVTPFSKNKKTILFSI